MWAVLRVGWAAVPVCACLPARRALLGAVLMLITCCMCCVCWNSVLRKLCWELLMQCLVCTVAGAGRVLRVRGAHFVCSEARLAGRQRVAWRAAASVASARQTLPARMATRRPERRNIFGF